MFRRLLPIIRLVIPTALILLALDLALFRSGFYYQWIERKSTAGAVMTARAWALHQLRPGMKNVLVLGDSRIGQGFSPALANQVAARDGINFVGVAIPGSTPRVWYYFLRSIDPQGERFAAVALMADSLRDDTLLEDFTNRELDLNYLAPLATPGDLSTLPGSFSKAELQERSRIDIVFPALAMQSDLRGFLRGPRARIEDIRRWNELRWQLMSNYPGVNERVPDLKFDPATGLPSDYSGMRPGLQQKLRGYFQTMKMKPSPDRMNMLNAYRNLWIGGIATRYGEHGIPVISFQMPRGPYHGKMMPVLPASGAYAEMASVGKVELLDTGTFGNLEQPQFFFDHIHLNSTGRKQFSEQLSAELKPLIP